MGRKENVEVFLDTKELCKTNQALVRNIRNSMRQQRMVLDEEGVTVSDKGRYGEPAEIIVSKKRTFEAASGYKGQKVSVLNFASATNPGGGVVKGSSAQEESLCRCSSLYFNLNNKMMWESFYTPHRAAQNPLHNDDCIYTPGVTVFKSDNAKPELLPEKEWYQVNVITCAAPNLRERPGNAMNPGDGIKKVKVTDRQLLEIHEKRLRKILDLAVSENNEVIILGAFGCGAFLNPSHVVAQAMKNVVMEYMHDFKVIEFAIYCRPGEDQNYKIFRRMLHDLGKQAE